jgi:hypothetical protein
VPVMLRGCISLPVTFRTHDNFRMESVLFDIAEVSLPFNAILGRPTLYQFMVVTLPTCVEGARPAPRSWRSWRS